MMDIVIPLGTGSDHANKELKYCLRSIRKHLTGYGNIYVVGEDPGFGFGEFIHVPAKDHGFNIQDNIRRKIEIACDIPGLSENFFFTNDDHIFLKPLDVRKMPYYYSGDIELAWFRKRKNGSYKSALEATNLILQEKCYATYHFDIHVPIIYNKKAFPKVMQFYPWATCRWGFVIKSLYANTMCIQGVEINDLNIGWPIEDEESIRKLIGDRFMFAFNQFGCTEAMFSFLESILPDVNIA